eukprot:jgi/Botrbrau1/6845/Bobra.152_2s0006.2
MSALLTNSWGHLSVCLCSKITAIRRAASSEEKAGLLLTAWHCSEDKNSTFRLVTCGGPDCPGNIVGRVYTSVPEAWSLIRNCICLDTRAIASYQLGQSTVHFGERSSVMGGPGRTLRSRTLLAGTTSVTRSSSRIAQEGGVTDRLELLEAEILKVQNVLLAHHQELAALRAAGKTRRRGVKRSSQS